MAHHEDHMDALRYMHLYFIKKEEKKMDEEGKAWNEERVNDILKAAYDLQNLCKTSIGCLGCPFHNDTTKCIFKSKLAIPCKWNIEKKTVYTVKLPQD